MKTCLLCVVVGAASAFELPMMAANVATARGMCPRTAATPFMVAAKDVFGQYYEASPPATKTMKMMPPPLAKGAMAGLVAVTGAAGFVLTPSRRIPVNLIGGALTGAVGNVARKRVSAERQKAAIPAVAALLSEGLPKVSQETLAAIASEYDVPKKEFQSQLAELYLTFLNACLNLPAVETSELSDLLRLQQLLKLSSAQVGAQIYSAARQLYSRHRAYLEDKDMNDSKRLLTKFVFLAERLLSEDPSPEGYKYESLRLQKLFSLSPPEWRLAAEEAAVPFYQKALQSAVMEAKPVTAQQLEAVRSSLGITEGCAEGMHAEVFAKSAAAMLEAEGKFTAADKERLTVTEALLGMPEGAASAALGGLSASLYASTFEAAVGALANPLDERAAAQQAGVLASRASELLLDADATAPIEAASLKTLAQAKLADAIKFMRANNMPDGVAAVRELIDFCETVAAFLTSNGKAAGDLDAAVASLFGGVTGDLKQSEVLSTYRGLLLHFLEDLKVDEAEAATLARLQTILGLSEAESSSVYTAAAGPLFRAALAGAVESAEYGDAQKAAIEQSKTDLALPASVTLSISMEIYGGKLKGFVGDDKKVLDEAQSAELEKMRAFLALEMEQVQPLHETVCGPAYSDSVKQVMSTSGGAIPDEYWEGLATLRERLCLTEDAAKAIFATEVQAKMREFGAKAVKALQEKLEGGQQQEDKDGSMNIAAGASFSTELINLVDFAVASKAIVTEDGKTVGIGANLRGEFSETALREMYKNYLIEAFSDADATTKARIFDTLGKLSLVLGLSDGEITSIHNEVGGMIYRQYVGKALVKGPLGKDDVTFLASIKDTLGMEQALCDELVRDQQQLRVSILVDSMFEKDQVLAEDVRKMRDTADLYKIDLIEDVQVSSVKLERFFKVELTAMLVEGDDLAGGLEELCESLHVTEERATTLLSELVQQRCSGGVLQAAADMRGGSTDSAVDQLKTVLKYAAVLEDVTAQCSVSAAERSELYTLFQASQLSGGSDPAERESQLETLRSVMGLAGVPA